MLDEGREIPAIGAELGVLPNTLHQAISYGRLKKRSSQHRSSRPRPPRPAAPTTQSARSIADGEALMGIATTRSMERVAAALGELENAQASFQIADDIPNGGVLCALPALPAFGLLRHSGSHFTLPKGFYPPGPVLLLLACLAPGRVPGMEQLRYHAPRRAGEAARPRPHPRSENLTRQSGDPR
jgi:hypothetical protein